MTAGQHCEFPFLALQGEFADATPYGVSHGSLQYYRSPSGKKFRSRTEALKSLGLVEDKGKDKTSPGKAPKAPKDQRLSHAEALTKAKADAAEAQLQLPLKLSSGVRIVK